MGLTTEVVRGVRLAERSVWLILGLIFGLIDDWRFNRGLVWSRIEKISHRRILLSSVVQIHSPFTNNGNIVET